MIPPRVHEATPPSERRIFDRLRLDPAAEEWTVLHSLGLSRRGNQPFGELDFVVLVPGAGVACIEVKGGRIRCHEGIWFTRDRSGREEQMARSPVAQARQAMFALRSAASRKFGEQSEEARLVYSAMVVLTDVPRPPLSPDYEPWEMIDVDDLRGPISAAILRALRQEAIRIGRSGSGSPATSATLKSVRNFFRPDFDIGIARATTIRRSEERIVRLTEEQYDVLDLFDLNPRCLVEGAAGTGKTLLALEFARRVAPQIGRVFVFSFNRLLGEWIARRFAEVVPQAGGEAGSYHACLRRLILRSPVAEEFRDAERSAVRREQDLFDLVYPLYGQLALAATGERADLLILDEAQDLLNEPILDVLNDWLTGGLAGGRWVMFGDFTRQSLYSRGPDACLSSLGRYSDHFTRSVLRRNCRNTRAIGEETALMSGFDSLPYRLDREDCLPVDYRYFRDDQHQVHRLADVLAMLARNGVPEDDVVILSPRRLEQSAAGALMPGSVRTIENSDAAPSGVRFSTIHAFKGLESPIVVLCDIENVTDLRARSLVYTGMSRARSHLVVLLHEGLRLAVSDALDRRLSQGWA